MIQITCTSCKNVLSIDDAFAGGVCRCQHCGTIQTVPAKLKSGASSVETAAAGKSAKSLYQNKARSALATGSGSGLEDLAGIVASSGLSDNRLRKPTQTASSGQKNLILILAIGGGLVVVLSCIILYLLLRGSPAPTSTPSASPANTAERGTTDSVSPKSIHYDGPGCLGIKLTSDNIVYLIDDGSSSEKILDYVKYAVYHSIGSLGTSTQFSIFFWKPDTASYGPATATSDHLDEAKAKVENVIGFQTSEIKDGLKKALAVRPGEIIVITAKAYDLTDSTTDEVLAARGNSSVRIHVIDINGSAEDTAASNIASKTGGTFVTISDHDLKGN